MSLAMPANAAGGPVTIESGRAFDFVGFNAPRSCYPALVLDIPLPTVTSSACSGKLGVV